MKSLIILVVASLAIGGSACGAIQPSSRKALTVRHRPNPTSVHSSPHFKRKPYPYMWYYRTEVTNNLNRPLRIISFDAFTLSYGKWIRRNILHRPLNSKDFTQWYTDGVKVKDGWIPPHETAACDPNWHGYVQPNAPRMKWSFIAVDEKGKRYYTEAEIKSMPIMKRAVNRVSLLPVTQH